jgi:hypothetical protein
MAAARVDGRRGEDPSIEKIEDRIGFRQICLSRKDGRRKDERPDPALRTCFDF